MWKERTYLHAAIFLFGFTAVLGELIHLHETHIIWWRTLICVVVYLLWFGLRRISLRVSRPHMRTLLLLGMILCAHWVAFYGCIKAAGSELALVLFSLGPAFTALLEPLYFRRRIYGYELLLSIVAAIGVFIIMQASTASTAGVMLGLAAALLNALYSIYSKKIVDQLPAEVVNFYTIGLAGVWVSLLLPVIPMVYGVPSLLVPPTGMDWMYLLILSIVCTNIAYVLCLKGLKGLSPFNFLLAINLEAVYGILFALLIMDRPAPGLNFWVGATVVAGTVLANIWFQNRQQKKAQLQA
jgi:drug/metabolite transporter (DMT)-like permease